MQQVRAAHTIGWKGQNIVSPTHLVGHTNGRPGQQRAKHHAIVQLLAGLLHGDVGTTGLPRKPSGDAGDSCEGPGGDGAWVCSHPRLTGNQLRLTSNHPQLTGNQMRYKS
jgi:hypothetical protein